MNTKKNNNQSKLVTFYTTTGFNRGYKGINAGDGLNMRSLEHAELEKIIQKVNAIKSTGFGEVRILIRNGDIYRILVTEEELLKHNRTE